MVKYYIHRDKKMKTFNELREELDEIAYKKDKKNHISSTKIKKTEIAYHSERKGSKKIRVFVNFFM